MPAAFETFVLGALFGVSIAAPVGPIGILCIQRTLSNGWRSGVVSGLGAATADAVYGAIVAFGVTAISSLLLTYASPLRLVGGLLLLVLGVQTLRQAPATESAEESNGRGLVSDYTTTLALTLANPVTILAFVAIVTGYSVAVGSAVEAGALVVGVFLGSVAQHEQTTCFVYDARASGRDEAVVCVVPEAVKARARDCQCLFVHVGQVAIVPAQALVETRGFSLGVRSAGHEPTVRFARENATGLAEVLDFRGLWVCASRLQGVGCGV
ncbi:LysE family transporter [Haladaptatus sp. DJG-WS-42]|uniref:LysE family translocator n=1 Tax=Haladaptatus sp. DJG-WS-42 TaxID=3120516 RepID=UPI0030CF7004